MQLKRAQLREFEYLNYPRGLRRFLNTLKSSSFFEKLWDEVYGKFGSGTGTACLRIVKTTRLTKKLGGARKATSNGSATKGGAADAPADATNVAADEEGAPANVTLAGSSDAPAEATKDIATDVPAYAGTVGAPADAATVGSVGVEVSL